MGIVTAAVNANTPTATQIGNNDPAGEQWGTSAASPLAVFGQTPTIQPPSQGSLKGIAAAVTVAAVTVTVASVAPNTTAEQAFAVTGAAVGQVVALQKPTVDAGIAIVGARASASGSVAITFANDTAATITPTAGQTYTFELIPAPMTISATLTPAAVAPNTFAEQQFAINGLGSGALIVNKPTAQAGLGIVNARIVSPGVAGITYANFTAATITPTAGESYLFLGVPEIQIAPVFKAITASITPVSVAAQTTAEQTFTVAGLPANSQVVVNTPEPLAAGLAVAGARVSALNTLALNFVNDTAAAITPAPMAITIGVFPAAAPAAGSSNTYNAQSGGPGPDHAALVATGWVAGP